MLACRPAGAEVQLSFAALGDLLAGVLEEALPHLPSPQRQALEGALLLTDVGQADQRAVATAFLNVLRRLAEDGPLVLAIDDVQWLDAPSASVVEFSVRRFESEPLGVLVSLRNGDDHPAPLALERAAIPLRRLTVGPLSLGALHELLTQRLDLDLSRPLLLRLHATSGGNPFYALEIGRAYQRRDLELGPDQPLPLPERLGELVVGRLTHLPVRAQRTLLFASALSQPTVALLEAATGKPEAAVADLDRAARAGVIELVGPRVRFSHPLLAAAAYAGAPAHQRTGVHRRLAEIVVDPEERARHLALAADGPNADVAAALEQAAAAAAARGAPEAAAELAEHATRLTPLQDVEDSRRRSMAAAEFHIRAGGEDRARELLEQLVAVLPAGHARAAALSQLAWARSDNQQACIELGEQALAEAEDDPRLSAAIHAQLAYFVILVGGELERAATHARAASELAERVGDEPLLARALTLIAVLEQGMGRPLPRALIARASALEEASGPAPTQPSASAWLGQMLMWAGDLDAPRPLLEAELERTTAIGDEIARTYALRVLSELEFQAGQWTLAREHAAEGESLMRLVGNEREQSVFLPAIGLIDAHCGRHADARAAAERGLALAEHVGQKSARARNLAVLGFVELSLGDAEKAHRYLGPAAELLLEMGVKVFTPFTGLHNEVDALVELRELDRAELLARELESHGRAGGSAWAEAVGVRGRARVLAGRGEIDDALAALTEAVEIHKRLPDPFERGRTLLALGAIQRQAKHKRAARETLEEAKAAFDRLGASLWSEKAAAELRRIGGRVSHDGELSETESRIAELVASGRTNQEVAKALSLSPKTVEWNLSKVYRKLGVRSRAELAAQYPRK